MADEHGLETDLFFFVGKQCQPSLDVGVLQKFLCKIPYNKNENMHQKP